MPPRWKTAGVTAARPRSLTLLVNEENAFKRAVAESLCAQLTTAALTVTVRELPWEDYAAALEGGDFDLYLGEVRLTADWDASALLDVGGALNYGGFASEQLSARNDALLLGGNASAERYVKGFAEEMPFAPLLFKSKTVLTPSGLVDGMTPTASDPFYGFADWQLPPLRLGELSAYPAMKKAFRGLLSVAKRFFNIQGRFPAQYWRTTATTLPSTSHSRPSMGW